MEYKNKSRNYPKLWWLAEQGSEIICWIKGESGHRLLSCVTHDNEHVVLVDANPEHMVFMDYCVFESKCVELDLEFLDPEPPTCDTCKHLHFHRMFRRNDDAWCDKSIPINNYKKFVCGFYEPEENK